MHAEAKWSSKAPHGNGPVSLFMDVPSVSQKDVIRYKTRLEMEKADANLMPKEFYHTCGYTIATKNSMLCKHAYAALAEADKAVPIPFRTVLKPNMYFSGQCMWIREDPDTSAAEKLEKIFLEMLYSLGETELYALEKMNVRINNLQLK
jgi:hypothetical protein